MWTNKYSNVFYVYIYTVYIYTYKWWWCKYWRGYTFKLTFSGFRVHHIRSSFAWVLSPMTNAYSPTGNLLKRISLVLTESIGRAHCWNSSLEKTTIRAAVGYFGYLAREATCWDAVPLQMFTDVYSILSPSLETPKKGVDPFIYQSTRGILTSLSVMSYRSVSSGEPLLDVFLDYQTFQTGRTFFFILSILC